MGEHGNPSLSLALFLAQSKRIPTALSSLFFTSPTFQQNRRRLPSRAPRAFRIIMTWGKLLLASSCALFAQSALAVTVYGQVPLGATRTLQPDASYTGLPAADPTTLIAPVISPIPGPYFLQLTNDVNAVGGVSIPVNGTFYGFSIEVSVVNQIREFPHRLAEGKR